MSCWLRDLGRLLREGICSSGLSLQGLLLLESSLHSILLRCLPCERVTALPLLGLGCLLRLHKTVDLTGRHHGLTERVGCLWLHLLWRRRHLCRLLLLHGERILLLLLHGERILLQERRLLLLLRRCTLEGLLLNCRLEGVRGKASLLWLHLLLRLRTIATKAGTRELRLDLGCRRGHELRILWNAERIRRLSSLERCICDWLAIHLAEWLTGCLSVLLCRVLGHWLLLVFD